MELTQITQDNKSMKWAVERAVRLPKLSAAAYLGRWAASYPGGGGTSMISRSQTQVAEDK
jgi:hypothetical protein